MTNDTPPFHTVSRMHDSGDRYLPLTPAPRNVPNVVQEHRIDRERQMRAHRESMSNVWFCLFCGGLFLAACWIVPVVLSHSVPVSYRAHMAEGAR